MASLEPLLSWVSRSRPADVSGLKLIKVSQANVDEYVGGKDAEIEGVIRTFQETSSSDTVPLLRNDKLMEPRKYRYMELSLQQRRKALLTKIPEIEQTLGVVNYLQLRRRKALGERGDESEKDDEDDLDDLDEDEGIEKQEEPLKTLFELNDTLYAEAEIQETGEVGLWLGVRHFTSSGSTQC